MSETAAIQGPIRTTVPARLDRLNWSPFTRMVCGLGAAWILDGLQITIASSVTGIPGRLEGGRNFASTISHHSRSGPTAGFDRSLAFTSAS